MFQLYWQWSGGRAWLFPDACPTTIGNGRRSCCGGTLYHGRVPEEAFCQCWCFAISIPKVEEADFQEPGTWQQLQFGVIFFSNTFPSIRHITYAVGDGGGDGCIGSSTNNLIDGKRKAWHKKVNIAVVSSLFKCLHTIHNLFFSSKRDTSRIQTHIANYLSIASQPVSRLHHGNGDTYMFACSKGNPTPYCSGSSLCSRAR